MPAATEDLLAAAVSSNRRSIGQVIIIPADNGFILCHREDATRSDLKEFIGPEDAIAISRFDELGNYRPLKTAPNLPHGWRLKLTSLSDLYRALDYFYPGRLSVLQARIENRLETTPLRETLNRQSGMYRIAAKISNEQLDDVVGRFCQSREGCLRTVLWRRDDSGAVASSKLPPEKFDPTHDQAGHGEAAIPLLCQEACNLLVNECRKTVKGESDE